MDAIRDTTILPPFRKKCNIFKPVYKIRSFEYWNAVERTFKVNFEAQAAPLIFSSHIKHY